MSLGSGLLLRRRALVRVGITVLYDSGTQVVPWTSVIPARSASYVAGNWSTTAGALALIADQNVWNSASNTSGGWRTTNTVDLTDVGIVRVFFDTTSSGSGKRKHVNVATASDANTGAVESETSTGNGAATIELNVSSLSGAYYVTVYGSSLRSSSGGTDGTNVVNAERVELE